MSQKGQSPTAVVLCPGRGTYQKSELGTLAPYYQSRALFDIDQQRQALGCATVSSLDSAERYLPSLHQLPNNNAALIFAAGVCQYQHLAQLPYEIVAVSGNSMGWYTALTCAGVWDLPTGTQVVTSMANITAQAEGAQFIYPLIDERWQPNATHKAKVEQLLREIPELYASIHYGGYAVLAGSQSAVSTAMAALPPIDERFPLLLAGHAAFHSPLMQEAASQALAAFSPECFRIPQKPLIDGNGRIWPNMPIDQRALWHYTFQTQVASLYDFKKAVQVAVREFAPDKLILLGPGKNLGGAVAQSLIEIGWQGLHSKEDFTAIQQSEDPLIITLD